MLTPGPWRVRYADGYYVDPVVEQVTPGPNAVDDAYLIAAAPAMASAIGGMLALRTRKTVPQFQWDAMWRRLEIAYAEATAVETQRQCSRATAQSRNESEHAYGVAEEPQLPGCTPSYPQ